MVRCALPSINSAIIFMSHKIEVTNSNFSSSFLHVDMLKKKEKKKKEAINRERKHTLGWLNHSLGVTKPLLNRWLCGVDEHPFFFFLYICSLFIFYFFLKKNYRVIFILLKKLMVFFV
jgi:hypothetical protein